eukprot:TRINITY_DN7104_c0_g1_i1.p3 TRINITY_DN7104_c0_g1~~TRINITY_DN7104_c0_g1_i1.p3  ORF type:complete len:195 (-),score=25.37 TRINITY_DN7104_c0_g1_i1:578-1162(-)
MDGNGYSLSDMYTNNTASPNQTQRSLHQPESATQTSSVSGANFQLQADARRIPDIYEHPNQRRRNPLKWIAIFLNAGILIGGSILIYKQHKKIQRQKQNQEIADYFVDLLKRRAIIARKKIIDLQKSVDNLQSQKLQAIQAMSNTKKEAEDFKQISYDLINEMYNIIQAQEKKIQEQDKQIKMLANELEFKIQV